MSDDVTLPLFLEHLIGSLALVLLGLGRRTGLLDAVLAAGGTAEELAARAGVDARNADEWLRGMTAAGYLTHEAGRYAPTDLTRFTFGPGFPVAVGAVLDGFWNAPQAYDDVVAAMRAGAGLSAQQLAPYAPFVGVNTPTYEQALVGDWIASVRGLTERLNAGAKVAELAPGNGAAAGILGRAFPQSTIVGYDLAPRTLPDLPANVEIREVDARKLPDDGPFDLVYCIDSLHHMSDPGAVLAGVKDALAPGGIALVAESDLSGDLDQDVADPMSTVALTSSVVYCLQDALHGGGEVHSCAEGIGWVVAGLEDAGFAGVAVHHSDTGYAIVTGVA